MGFRRQTYSLGPTSGTSLFFVSLTQHRLSCTTQQASTNTMPGQVSRKKKPATPHTRAQRNTKELLQTCFSRLHSRSRHLIRSAWGWAAWAAGQTPGIWKTSASHPVLYPLHPGLFQALNSTGWRWANVPSGSFFFFWDLFAAYWLNPGSLVGQRSGPTSAQDDWAVTCFPRSH